MTIISHLSHHINPVRSFNRKLFMAKKYSPILSTFPYSEQLVIEHSESCSWLGTRYFPQEMVGTRFYWSKSLNKNINYLKSCRHQYWNHFPVLIPLLHCGAIPLCFATLRAEEKMQLRPQTYQEGISGYWCCCVWLRAPKQNWDLFQSQINKVYGLLACYALSRCGLLSLIWDNIVIKSS